MPIIDLGGDLTCDEPDEVRSANAPRLARRLLAFSMWPTDAANRDQYLAAGGREILAQTRSDQLQAIEFLEQQNGPLNPKQRQSYQRAAGRITIEALEEEVEPFGGALSLGSNWGAEDDKRAAIALRNAGRAGYMLRLLASMAVHHAADLPGGPSRAKARDALELHFGSRRKGMSRKALDEAWSDHKTVAHILAGAHQVLASKQNAGTVDENASAFDAIVQHPIEVVVRAAAFEKFAITYMPKRSPVAVISPNEIWSFDLPINVPSVEQFVPPLDQKILKFLSTTRKSNI